ncbi:MAG: hypothetical protein B7X06_02835 [Verrucomicrobia bacterium 21-51-4]|nr:MAG: hypothetical protein B7X06_02835 [Verrucomicrobia bacterium 21-51-4]
MRSDALFTLPGHMPFQDFFKPEMAPWEWVRAISEALREFDFLAEDAERPCPPGVIITGDVCMHPTVKLPPFAVIQGPTWIGAHTEIRPGAYIRGNVIVGEHCVLGNSCEYKNCLLMDHVETAHFNYIGDSILGTRAHLGAGVILANVRLDRGPVKATTPAGQVLTELKKLGAMIGEAAEIGCNSVVQPGTIVGAHAKVMPLTSLGGYIPKGATAGNRLVPEITFSQNRD